MLAKHADLNRLTFTSARVPAGPSPPLAEQPVPAPKLPGADVPASGRWPRAGAAAAERQPRALPWGRGPARPGPAWPAGERRGQAGMGIYTRSTGRRGLCRIEG